jgi:hypothetical protein
MIMTKIQTSSALPSFAPLPVVLLLRRAFQNQACSLDHVMFLFILFAFVRMCVSPSSIVVCTVVYPSCSLDLNMA